ncbi:MAG: hypothetical protein IGS39_00675 [Calothrix sp. C42_A2020_038]|nr:hypothetical protein [Calothrix sp. C42_A2020_038]
MRRRLNQWNSCSLWEHWVLATSIGFLVGLTVIDIVGVATSHFGYIRGTFTLLGALEGVILGFAQWLVLRRHVKHSARWILATVIGILLAWFTGLSISTVTALAYISTSNTIPLVKGLVCLGAVLGGVLGLCQWFVLKQIRFSIWWIVANAFAWALGLLVAFVGTGIVRGSWGVHVLITAATGVAMGAIIGGITGITLVWLLKPYRKPSH